METVPAANLSLGMRLDESLHLADGELVLYRYQAVDGMLLDALAETGVSELFLCSGAAEAEGLTLSAERAAVRLDELPANARFRWGLYEASGRKLLSSGRQLVAHRRNVLGGAGVDVVVEPMGETASRIARLRRRAARRRLPRPGSGATGLATGLFDSGRLPEPAATLEGRAGGRAEGRAAEGALAYAVLASEAEAVMDELAVGVSLDVPRAVEAARGVVREVFVRPVLIVACALEGLASGRLRDHATASAAVAVAAARAMGYGEDDCLELALCALLHDASMAWVREDVLTNPEPLTRTGLRAVRRHPLRALATLSDADGLAPAVAIASACVHERLDGSGYPMGLAGEEIAPAARLLAAVDVTVALMAPRPHRREMSAPGAMDLVAAMAADDLLDAAAARAVRRACGL